MRRKTPLLSIIIPTLNEKKYLLRLLKSIKKQDFKDYEIIVADYNSKDNTRKIAKKFGCRITKGGKPAVGRNNGAKIAKGDILLFLDADVVLPKSFLRKTIGEFIMSDADVATCFSIPHPKSFLDNTFYLFGNIIMWGAQFFNPYAPGHCIFAKKKAHNRIKGFDKTVFIMEDHDYIKRIIRFGKYRILSPRIRLSVRRLQKEGRLGLVLKYIHLGFFRILKGTPRKEIFKYEFGRYS